MARLKYRANLQPRITVWSVMAALVCVAIFTVGCESASDSIFFTSDRDGNSEIYVVDSRGESQINLTETSDDESTPVVSPSRKLIAFRSQSRDQSSVEVMSVDGSARTLINKGFEVHRSQRWSDDSKRIAYVMEQMDGPTIFVATVEEPEPIPLTAIAADEVGDWSDDGNSVVFAVRSGKDRGLWVRNPDGVNEVRLTETADYAPVWSPNSDQIAFLSTRDGNPEIYIMSSDGTDQARITETEADEYDLVWSPNGRQLLFISERDGNPEVYVSGADGKEQIRLTLNSAMDARPVWSPNGKKIVFVSYLDGDGEIFVMKADGSDQIRLTNNEAEDTDPSW